MKRDTPFANCRYQHCGSPGQCVSEGACHHPDRLGDALREIARGMSESGTASVNVTVVVDRVETTYELKLVNVRYRAKRRRTSGEHHRRRHVLP